MTKSRMTEQSQIRFEWASPEQLEEVWQLHESTGAAWSHPKPFFEESLNYHRVLIARDGTKPIAYVLYQILWGNTAFASLMRILPEYQRKGVGTAMAKVLEERLISQGFRTCLASSETVNPDTKQFLPNLGFKRIGELNMQHGGEIFYLKPLV